MENKTKAQKLEYLHIAASNIVDNFAFDYTALKTIVSRESKRNMSSSEDENMHVSSEDESEYFSHASENSFVSATGDFVPYDQSIEPVANEDEAAQHAMQVAEEEEEEKMLLSRFSGEVDAREWCVGFCCEVFFSPLIQVRNPVNQQC